MFAFDYGGVLRVRDGLHSMRRLAKAIAKSGTEVYCISAIGSGQKAKFLREVALLGIPFTAVHFVYFPHWPPLEGDLEIVGAMKAEAMKRCGCTVLFDDDPVICEQVRKQGLTALLVVK